MKMTDDVLVASAFGVWKISVGALIALALLLTVASLTNINEGGDFGFRQQPARSGSRVTRVLPGSPAAKAGLHPGDVIFTQPTLAARVVAESPRRGDRLIVHLNRPDGPALSLTATASPPPPFGLLLIVVLTRCAFLLIAGIVAWRRGDDPAARALALFLAAYGAALGINFNIVADPNLRFVPFLLTETLFALGAAAVLAFACSFPPPQPGGIRERLLRATPAIGALGLLLAGAHLFSGFVFGNFTATRVFLVAYAVWYATVLVLALGSFIASYRTASGAERVRMWWMLMTFAIGFSGVIAILIAGAIGVLPTWVQYSGFTALFIPVGLGYTILRHRVLDIGFVVNRAVVYTGVSFVVVGLFITFEWLLGHLVEQGSNTSVTLQLGGALALGLSVRFIHNRVDRYVDDVFFRERHAAEAAVRRFAREAALITTPEELVRKTVEVAQSRMRLSACAFYARQGDLYVAMQSTFADAKAVDENDYAILEMRTWHTTVDPHDRNSALVGELAFPMIVRGELAGFLLCGEKETREAFAPDERDALAVLARDAGIALDSLRVRIVERELATLAGEANLPSELRTRLSTLLDRR